MKKFSVYPNLHVIGAGQNQLLTRIAKPDSRRELFAGELHEESDAHANDARDDSEAMIQKPSLLLSRSLTACGFALPPDDFIT